MNVARFRSLFRAVLLAGPCASVACSGVAPTEMPERAQCADLSGANRYLALTLSPGTDGIAFATRAPGASDPSTFTVSRLSSLGAPCATAKDRTACLRRVDELLNDKASGTWIVNNSPGCGSGHCGGSSFTDLGVITAGDTVRLATLEDVLRATAPVETRDEAAAFLVLQQRATDCNTNNVRRDGDGWTFRYSSNTCDGGVSEHFTKVNAATGAVSNAGSRELRGADNDCMEGRRPANLASTGVAWLASLSACFSEIAHMEAAAVIAFDELEQQLAAVGLPDSLMTRVRRARADEVMHAAVTARLAHRFGGTPTVPRVEPTETRATILQLALDNAVEGCVREAFGALVAAHQASHASDAEVRAAFSRIAADEAAHAELSFDLDAWLVAQLTDAERCEVAAAKRDAWRDLVAACAVEPAREVVAVAGQPSARDARKLLSLLEWATSEAA